MSDLSTLLDELAETGARLAEVAYELRDHYSAKPEQKFTLIDVRQQMVDKMNVDGGKFKSQVKALVERYSNGGTLSSIDPVRYGDLLKELEAITDG